MDEVKGLLQSRTFWGVVVSTLGKIGAGFGYVVTEGDQQLLVTGILGLASFAGDIMAIYGRAKATKKIGKPE